MALKSVSAASGTVTRLTTGWQAPSCTNRSRRLPPVSAALVATTRSTSRTHPWNEAA
jgi:hypothetical protein